MKRTIAILGIFLTGMTAVPSLSFCGYDYHIEESIQRHENYESEVSGKLERGATNLLFGWTEIFRVPAAMSESPKAGFFKSAALGVPYGLARFVGRTVVGAYEIVSFWAPQGPIFEPIQGEVS